MATTRTQNQIQSDINAAGCPGKSNKNYLTVTGTTWNNRVRDYYGFNVTCQRCGGKVTQVLVKSAPYNPQKYVYGTPTIRSWTTTSVTTNLGYSGFTITHTNNYPEMTRLVTEINQAKARDNAISVFDTLNLTTRPNKSTAAEAKRQLDIILTNAGSSYEGYTSRLAKYNTYVANLSTTEQLNISVGSLREQYTNISGTMLPGKVSRYTDIYILVELKDITI